MLIDEIRRSVINEEIDYLLLTSLLKKQYKRPRDKITQLLKSKALVRIKNRLETITFTTEKNVISRNKN